jgi:group I intron endonuclease
MGFIYKLTYRVTRKAYIGQTIRPIEERLKEHQQPNSGCRAILGAIQKYGWDNFDNEWYEVPDEDLNFYEEMLVTLLGTLAPSGYNLKEGGGSGKMSEETKQKMSKARTGQTHTEETKQKMSKALTGEKHYMYGKTHTEETKKNLSKALTGEKNPFYGKTHSEESKQKISEANSGEKAFWYGKEHTEETKKKQSKSHSGENNRNSKKVYQYTLDGTYVDSFASGGEAARALGKTDGTLIRKCARGKQPSAYGFKWYSEKL